MYVPPAFATDEPEALELLERAAFGALVTRGSGRADGDAAAVSGAARAPDA